MKNTVPRFIVKDPAADPMDDLAQCQAALVAADWWGAANMTEHWPLSTQEAADLLTLAGEYDTDAADLSYLIGRNLLPSPAIAESGEFEWSAADVVLSTKTLEERRQWQLTPSRHDSKKHPCQIVLEQARKAGAVDAVVVAPEKFGGVKYDVHALLIGLTECETREGRERALALLRGVLEVDHGIIV